MKRLGNSAKALLVCGAVVFAVSEARPLPASAQSAASGQGGVFGAGAGPIDITADQLEVIDAENRAVWRGSVEAIQGANRMRAPSLTVYFAKSGQGSGRGGAPGAGWGGIQRMEADGPVYYVTPQQNARGDHATYDAASNTIVMTGNVVLVQDKNVVQGDRLVIDTKTNHSTLSNTQGTGTARVRGVFYPNQSQQPGAAAPATAGQP
jgi:lipopolysaccharide export system protein LptA